MILVGDGYLLNPNFISELSICITNWGVDISPKGVTPEKLNKMYTKMAPRFQWMNDLLHVNRKSNRKQPDFTGGILRMMQPPPVAL